MYRSTRLDEGWDGPFRAQVVQPDVYVWRLEAQVAYCGRMVAFREFGDVTVVR